MCSVREQLASDSPVLLQTLHIKRNNRFEYDEKLICDIDTIFLEQATLSAGLVRAWKLKKPLVEEEKSSVTKQLEWLKLMGYNVEQGTVT